MWLIQSWVQKIQFGEVKHESSEKLALFAYGVRGLRIECLDIIAHGIRVLNTYVCTEMQTNVWARLRESQVCHAT